MKTRILPISMVATALALSACGVQGDTTKNTNTGESEQQAVLPGDRKYYHVEDLKDALVAEGFPCSKWEREVILHGHWTAGKCDDFSILMVFGSDSEGYKEEVIETYKSDGESYGLPSYLVVGKNWLIANTSDAEDWAEGWAEKLGAKADVLEP